MPDTATLQGATPLPHLGIIQAVGPDAASFLHGQLSQDIQGLEASTARRAAYCSVKGRMVADALVLRPAQDQLLLLMDAEVLPATLKKLSMFVMRAKARLSDAQGSLALVGLVGSAALDVPGLADVAPYTVQTAQTAGESGHAAAWVLRLPDVLGTVRAIWVGPADEAATVVERGRSMPLAAWNWLEVMSGIPRITSATVDQFVPQMINFELVGGINFKKGCYPGQEIVARSQYRGTTKRRLFLLHGEAPLGPGQEIFSAEDPGQPAGMVVNASEVPGRPGHWSALVELKLQYAQTRLALGSVEGPALSLDVLPYEVVSLDD